MIWSAQATTHLAYGWSDQRQQFLPWYESASMRQKFLYAISSFGRKSLTSAPYYRDSKPGALLSNPGFGFGKPTNPGFGSGSALGRHMATVYTVRLKACPQWQRSRRKRQQIVAVFGDYILRKRLNIVAGEGHSRSSKVDDFGTNRKRVWDFLLVINSNFGPIFHRFRDTATY